MSSAKMTQEAKKDEFKKYLEKAGVLEMLTKSLVQLYEEPDKPSDAVNYLKSSVGGSADDKVTIVRLEEENQQLKNRVEELQTSRVTLENRIKDLETVASQVKSVEQPPIQTQDSAQSTPVFSEPEQPKIVDVQEVEEASKPEQEMDIPKEDDGVPPAAVVNSEPVGSLESEKPDDAKEVEDEAPKDNSEEPMDTEGDKPTTNEPAPDSSENVAKPPEEAL
jgi:hypothetical protein